MRRALVAVVVAVLLTACSATSDPAATPDSSIWKQNVDQINQYLISKFGDDPVGWKDREAVIAAGLLAPANAADSQKVRNYIVELIRKEAD